MKIYKLAQSQTIGPVYHGTVYKFKPEEIRRDRILFFSDDKIFAHDYASQKSFERQMDADITVFAYYIKGNLFDPQNPKHVEMIVPYLSDKITVYNDFGMDANLTLERWKEMISGVYTEQPYWSEEELRGKKIGDALPENDTQSRPLKYELIKITPDDVYYVSRGTLSSIISGVYSFAWERDINKDRTVEEVANDIINLGHSIEFMRKYRTVNMKHDIHVMHRTRHAVTTQNNDVWRWLEGDGVFDAMQKAGFNIVKSRERRKLTYAVFPSAEVIPVK